MKIHRFRILVNCDLSGGFENLYEDHGLIILPEQYSEEGRPTRLVINCHGAGGTVATDDSQVEHQAITLYLVANGYAVMDVNGLPEKYAVEKGIDLRNNIGSPIAIESYVKAYHYCMETYNLKREVFVHGGSMGGISGTNLTLSGRIPVIAQSSFCPVLDTYNEIFLHPWSDGLPRLAMGKIYGLEVDPEGEYIYDEQKLAGYNPARNERIKSYPVPVKFWQCEDDEVVSCFVTRQFVDFVRAHGGEAYLRTFPQGGHEPQLVGPFVDAPSGKLPCGEAELDITPAVEEVYVWIKSHDD